MKILSPTSGNDAAHSPLAAAVHRYHFHRINPKSFFIFRDAAPRREAVHATPSWSYAGPDSTGSSSNRSPRDHPACGSSAHPLCLQVREGLKISSIHACQACHTGASKWSRDLFRSTGHIRRASNPPTNTRIHKACPRSRSSALNVLNVDHLSLGLSLLLLFEF